MFIITTSNYVGPVTAIVVSLTLCYSDDAWYVDWIKVTDNSNGAVYYTGCYGWMGKGYAIGSNAVWTRYL